VHHRYQQDQPTAADPIRAAASDCDSEENIKAVIKVLLTKGVVVSASNDLGATALHVACNTGHLETAQLLLDHGAVLDATDNITTTLLCTM